MLSFNQDSPSFGECVLNKRKLSKLYDKSCRGKRSVSITEQYITGMRARGSAEALMEVTAERRHWTQSMLLGSRVYAGQDL